MSKGRIFPPEIDHAYVAKWLRAQAKRGFQRGDDKATWTYVDTCCCGVNLNPFPNSISLILTRDLDPDCVIGWHLSVCCVTDRGYRGYQADEGEHWLELIFGPYRERAVPQPLKDRGALGIQKDIRHWVIECGWKRRTDPVVDLDGLP